MLRFVLIVLFASTKSITSQTLNVSDGIHPWESYVKLVHIQRPLGITLNLSSLVHHHFAIGYLCFHSFMYDEAQEAFDLAIELDSTFIEAYIGKMLACKNILTNETDISCGRTVYDAIQTTNVTLTSLQSALINAVYQWFTNESLIFAGERAFLSSIADLSTIYPDETDIHTLWGLGLLNVAFQNDYDGQLEPEPMLKAREILKSVLIIEPNHPGAIQYLIRCYDIAQISIAQQAINYITSYQNLGLTLSYAYHLPAQIWLRIGEMVQAKLADDQSVRTSFILCSIKQLKKMISISSTELNDYLVQFNTSDEISTFLKCDDDVRALATEWLSNTRLQTGNWIGTIQTTIDLYTAYNLSNPMSYLYLAAAYRTRARTLTSIFYWLPYDIQFINRAEEINNLDKAIPLVSLGDDTTTWSYAWSEAGYRFSECIRILTQNYTNSSDPIIDTHINRLSHLANQTLPMNRYVSTSISLMLPFIQGIIYYKNASYQQCLNVLNDATQTEFNLVLDNNSPTLIYARASELLAIHLLLIHRIYQQESKQLDTITFNLNGSEISVSNFPQRALELYTQANLSAPNRAVNILGTARAYSQMHHNSEAAKFYKILINQITSTNTSDPIFSQEANDFITKYENIQNHGNKKQIYFSTFFLIVLVSIFNS